MRLTTLAIAALPVMIAVCVWSVPKLRMEVDPSPNDHGRFLLRSKPRHVLPTTKFAKDVDSLELAAILEKLYPSSPKPMPSVVMATHALRLWGTKYRIAEGARVPEGLHFRVWMFDPSTLLQALLDDEIFQGFYPSAEPLLQRTDYGISVRYKVGNFNDMPINRWPDCEAHVDKVASVLGECGIPCTHVVKARGYQGTVADILNDSASRFVATQELEFSCKAYLYYAKDFRPWSNRWGEGVSLEDMLVRISTKKFGDGACYGIHCLQVIALALRIDIEEPFLATANRRSLENYLSHASELLVLSQSESGAWPADWGSSGVFAVENFEDPAAASIRSTGHHLEWIAIAPSQLCPPPESIRKAMHFLASTLQASQPDNFYHNYPSISHAGRALLLLSGRDIADVMSSTNRLNSQASH